MLISYSFIKIGVWNIHGLFVKINKIKLNKLDDPQFIRRLKSFDILCLQEILCGPNETNSLSVPGYKILPFHRKISGNNRYYGGSLIFVKNDLRAGIKVVTSFAGDKIWIRLKKDFFNFKNDIYFCFNYASLLLPLLTLKTLIMILFKPWKKI